MKKLNKPKRKINYDKIVNNRFIIFFVVILFLFGLVTIRIINVMLVNEEKFSEQLSVLTYTEVSGASSPRGRIYDRNYNILVDNKSLKTITYQKKKGTTNLDMIESATQIATHLEIDYSKLTERAKREFYFAKNKEECDKLVTKEEQEKVKQHKLSQRELEELKLTRIPSKKLNFSEEEQKIAYIYYLMNKGYTYE